MLTGILGVLGRLSGLARKADDSETVQKLIDGVDHLNLSPEETVKYVIEQKKLSEAGENSIRSVTRRILAVTIIGSVFAWLWLGVIFWWINQEFTKFIIEILKLDIVFYSATSVVIFYFGYYGLKKGIEAWKGK